MELTFNGPDLCPTFMEHVAGLVFLSAAGAIHSIGEGNIMKTNYAIVGLCMAGVSLASGCAANKIEVTQFGQMHKVLAGGADKAVAVVSVGDVLARPDAIGVGALMGLKGEITICDGKAWVARRQGTNLVVEGSADASHEQASMMTVSHVAHWQEVPIDRDLSGEALEEFIAEHAAASGIDASKPFPFMLDGDLIDLQLHVIHGACPMRPGARLTAAQEPWRMTIDLPTPGRVVGFYAAESVGKLTHPGTSMHAHVLMQNEGHEITGHAERLGIAGGGMLMLPDVQ